MFVYMTKKVTAKFRLTTFRFLNLEHYGDADQGFFRGREDNFSKKSNYDKFCVSWIENIFQAPQNTMRTI